MALIQDNSMPWDPMTPIAAQSVAQEDPPSLSPAEIARLAKQFYDDHQAIRRLWLLCSDVLSGFREYMNADAAVRPGMESNYFNRARDVSFNITQPSWRNASSRLMLAQPAWGARAASYSAADLAKAQACEQMLMMHYTVGEVKSVNQQAVDWAITFGTSALLTEYVGTEVVEQAFGPDRLRAEPGIFDPDKSRFLALSRITTKSALTKKFPDMQDAISQCKPPMQQQTWWGNAQRMAQDRIEVLEVYTREGHCYLLCGDGGTVLWEGRTPKNCMPIQIIYCTKLPNFFFGMGLVEQAIPAQYAFTASWNQIITNARLMSNPKILIEQNSGIAPDAFSSRPGEKVFYRNKAPQPWTGSPLPQYAQQLPAAAQSAMADMTGIHAQALGKRTPGITTGRAMETLISSDEVQFEHTKGWIKKAIERQGRVALLYMQEYYPPEKVIRQFDRYGPAIAVELRATELSEDPQVFVEADTLFAADAQARQERTMALAQQVGLPPDKLLFMLQNNIDILKPQKPISDYLDAKRALDLVVAQGFMVPDPRKLGPDGMPAMRKSVKFYPTDNLQVFADVARQYIRSAEFDALDEDRQDDVDKYYMDVLELMQGAAAGATPAPGQPGSGQAPLPKAARPPGLPEGASAGGTPGNAGNPGTGPEREVAAQQAQADVAGA